MQFRTTLWTEISRAKGGSKEALDGMLARYRPPILHYLIGRGLPEHDAEDVVQEVILEITQDGFLARADRGLGRFRTLLLRVTQHVLSSEFRKKYSQKRGGGMKAVPIEEIMEKAAAVEEDEDFNRQWAKNLIDLAMEAMRQEAARLKAPYVEALSLRFYEGKSAQEIAERLQCSTRDVENYLYKGKQRLKRHLQELASEYSSTPEEHAEDLQMLERYLP